MVGETKHEGRPTDIVDQGGVKVVRRKEKKIRLESHLKK